MGSNGHQHGKTHTCGGGGGGGGLLGNKYTESLAGNQHSSQRRLGLKTEITVAQPLLRGLCADLEITGVE